MKADYQSYQRATTVSLIGLFLQLSLAVLLVIYGYLARDHAAVTASLFMGVGVIVWLVLAIVSDQHRRERIESIEAESYAASDAAGSSVFEESAGELRVAARRLQTMHRIVVPVVSLVVGGLLVGVGIFRFIAGQELVSPDAFTEPEYRGWAVAIGLAVAFVGFVFARFVSGMAKQKVWSNLNAGAAYAVGSSLFGLAIAVAHFIDIGGPDVVLRYLQVAFPVVMIALGAEVFLNFLLEVYRPRKPGEVPRPAFGSKVLGFAAAPDRIAESISEAINYQFGFDVASSWFYRLLSRSLILLVLLAVVVVWGLSSFTVVQPHQRAMLLRFGGLVEGRENMGPGLVVKFPWPIDQLEIPTLTETDPEGRVTRSVRTATGVRVLTLGTNPPAPGEGPILWTEEHSPEEIFSIVRPTPMGRQADDPLLRQVSPTRSGGEVSLVAVEVPLHYVIDDVHLYDQLAPEGMRDLLLEAIGQRAVMQYLQRKTVEDVLSVTRTELAAALRERITREFAQLNGGKGPGIQILFVGAEGAHPPKDAAPAFERVVQAQQNYQGRLEDARKQEIETLTEVVGSVEQAGEINEALMELEELRTAGASAEEIIEKELNVERLLDEVGGRAANLVAEARADRWQRHMSERGRAARYQGQLAAYRAAPVVYKADLYFDAMRSMIMDARLYITSDLVPDLRIEMDLHDRESTLDIFGGGDEDE